MRSHLVRCGRVLLAVAGFCGAEVLAAIGAISPIGILLGVGAQAIVAAGLAAGVLGLVVGAVRRRTGRPAGGVTTPDLVVHAALLVNTLLLATATLLPPSVPSDPLLAARLTTGMFALIGVPVSVGLTWRRAWTPLSAPVRRGRAWTVGVAHGLDVAAAVALLAWAPLGAALLGSSTI